MIFRSYLVFLCLFFSFAFAVVPGTKVADNEGNGESDPIVGWQADEVQHFWWVTAYLMGYQGPRWWKFKTAAGLYRGMMAKLVKVKGLTINETMEAYPPKLRIKQF